MEEVEKKREESPKDLLRFALIAAIIIIPIRIWIMQPFIVSGSSMYPNYVSGDYLIVDQISYYFIEPKRGEVIVFKSPIEKGRYLVKRVIGLPNDTIHFTQNGISITTKDGVSRTIKEPFVDFPVQEQAKIVVLKNDEYFVMGDNRQASADSRMWGGLPAKNIMGRVLLRAYPLKNIDFFPAYYDFGFDSIELETVKTKPQ